MPRGDAALRVPKRQASHGLIQRPNEAVMKISATTKARAAAAVRNCIMMTAPCGDGGRTGRIQSLGKLQHRDKTEHAPIRSQES